MTLSDRVRTEQVAMLFAYTPLAVGLTAGASVVIAVASASAPGLAASGVVADETVAPIAPESLVTTVVRPVEFGSSAR